MSRGKRILFLVDVTDKPPEPGGARLGSFSHSFSNYFIGFEVREFLNLRFEDLFGVAFVAAFFKSRGNPFLIELTVLVLEVYDTIPYPVSYGQFSFHF